MAQPPLTNVLRYLRRTCAGPSGELTDSDLLQRFITCRDAAAFTILVERHGPMVLGVCQRERQGRRQDDCRAFAKMEKDSKSKELPCPHTSRHQRYFLKRLAPLSVPKH